MCPPRFIIILGAGLEPVMGARHTRGRIGTPVLPDASVREMRTCSGNTSPEAQIVSLSNTETKCSRDNIRVSAPVSLEMAPTNPLKLSDEEMLEVKQDVFESLRPFLCSMIIAERHFDYLRSKKILNVDDTEEISLQTTSRKRAGELLDRLAKNPKGLDALIESIRLMRTQDFLIEKITDEALRLKMKKLTSYTGSSLSTYVSSPTTRTSELSSDSKLFVPEMESTALYHPEGESSLSLYCRTSVTLPEQSVSGHSQPARHSTLVSSRLPRPGEPGAPPLPSGPQEAFANSPTDNQFLPLRSNSLSAP